MRILAWHVHGSWTTALVQGAHTYLLPVTPDRGPDGRGRARTWDWPAAAVEVPLDGLRDIEFDVVLLQRPEELDLVERWTGRRPGRDVPALYVEHDAPRGGASDSVHPLADQDAIPVVHVTQFNRTYWDTGRARALVLDHGVLDPGYRYTGTVESVAVVVNDPVRRHRVAGTDLVLDLAAELPVAVYGMGVDRLQGKGLDLFDDLPQARMHDLLATHRLYFHPYRWTSLGLSLIEAMMLGMPVLGLPATAAPEAVPAAAGVLSSDSDVLLATARRWLADPEEARTRGLAAREHALERFGIDRFLGDLDAILASVVQEVTA